MFQSKPALAEGQGYERLAIVRDKHIEYDINSGRLRGESLHARSGRVNPLQQRIERKAAAMRHGDFSIKHEALRGELRESLHHLGEISCKRLQRLRLKLNVSAIAECDTTKAVPLGLVLPVLTFGDGVHRESFHWGQR